MNHQPVCVKCQHEMGVAEVGVLVAEIVRGIPYKIWSADKHKCPVCGTEVIAAFASQPFAEMREQAAEILQKAKAVGKTIIEVHYK